MFIAQNFSIVKLRLSTHLYVLLTYKHNSFRGLCCSCCTTAPSIGTQGGVCVCVSVRTSIYGSECWTQWAEAGGANVVVMVTMAVGSVLLVTCCPGGEGRRRLGGKERRRGGQWDVWCTPHSFFLFDSILVRVGPPLSAVLLFGFDQFGQRFSSRPLAPPDSTQQHSSRLTALTAINNT